MKKIFIVTLLFISSSSSFAQNLDSLLIKLNTSELVSEKNEYRKKIGDYYESKQVLSKAIDYYQEIRTSGDISLKDNIKITKKIASLQQRNQDYEAALVSLKNLLMLVQNPEDKIDAYEQLAYIAKKESKTKEALGYLSQALDLTKDEKTLNRALLLNNMGYLEKELENYEDASNHFKQALTINQFLIDKNKKASPENTNILFLNKAANLVHLNRVDEAIASLQENMITQKEANNMHGQATTLNFLAATHLANGNTLEALFQSQKAIEIGDLLNSPALLSESYLVLSEVYNEDDNFQNAQEAYKKHLFFLEEQRKKAEQKRQNLAEKQVKAEKEESAIKEEIAAQKEEALTLQQLQLEAEKREKEVALLEEQKKLQEEKLRSERLERERYRQMLAISQQRLEAERRQKALDDSEKARELQNLELQRKEIERQEQVKALQLLETEKKLQEQQLKEEEIRKKNTYVAIGLILLLLVSIAVAFLLKMRANRKLKQKQDEITQRNEELRLQQEEISSQNEELLQVQDTISAQRDLLAQNNDELSEYRHRMDQSISSAKLIQNAILPTEQKMQAHFSDFFVLYLPQQIVSGDFYWLETFRNKTIFVLADCTGHGVSGAFMTLIGSALLEQIILIEGETKPSLILDNLHKKLQTVLQQKETGNMNGMDISILILEKSDDEESFDITFAAAKQNLYYKIPNQSLQTIKGSRKIIGGRIDRNRKAEDHNLTLPINTQIYLASDGFADQNNLERRKFGSHNFQKLLDDVTEVPMSEQKDILLEVMNNHKKGVEQRDDIAIAGVKL